MNERAPQTSGLQIALILSVMLAMILGVAAYLLYRENQELKQQLERQPGAQAGLPIRRTGETASRRPQLADDTASNSPSFLLVSCSQRYNRM